MPFNSLIVDNLTLDVSNNFNPCYDILFSSLEPFKAYSKPNICSVGKLKQL